MRTIPYLALATLVLVAASAAEASRTEPTVRQLTGQCVQYDGGRMCDASDVCSRPSPLLRIGTVTTGRLVPVDDTADNYGLYVPTSRVGRPVVVLIESYPALPPAARSVLPPHALHVYTPGCVTPADGAAPDEAEYTFVPRTSGVYTVQITYAGLAGLAPFAPATFPRACDIHCVQTGMNLATGYLLTTY